MANNINIGVGVTLDVKASGAVKSLNKAERATKKLADTEGKRAKAAKAVEGRLKTQRNALARQAGALRRTSDAMRTMNAASVLQNATMAIGSIAIAGTIAALVALLAIIVTVVNAWAQFEQGLVRATAVMQIGAVDSNNLRKTILKLGRTTLASFNDIAKSAEQFARAGLRVNAVMAILPQAIRLSIAAGTGLIESTEIIIRTLFGFGLAIEDLESALDTLAFVSIKANVTLQQLGQSMKFIAPVARVAGIDFEEVTAALGLMGNAGIQASLAGTTLRAAIARLVNPSRDAEVIMAQFGLTSEVVGGKITSLARVIGRLNDQNASVADIFAIFGLRAGPGMAALLSIGQDALEEFTRAARAANGVMADLSQRNMQALNAKFTIFRANVTGITLGLGEMFVRGSGLGAFFDSFTDALGRLNDQVDATNFRANLVAEFHKVTEELQLEFNQLGELRLEKGFDNLDTRVAKGMFQVMDTIRTIFGTTKIDELPDLGLEALVKGLRTVAVEQDRLVLSAARFTKKYGEAKEIIAGFSNAEIATVNPLIQANKAIRTQEATVEAWVRGWKDVFDVVKEIPNAEGVIKFMFENVDAKAEAMLETLGFIPPKFEALRLELHKLLDVSELKKAVKELEKLKGAASFTPEIGSLTPVPLPRGPKLPKDGDMAQFNKDLAEYDRLVKGLEAFPTLAAPDRRTFRNMEAFTFLTRAYKDLRDDLVITGIPFSVPDEKDFSSMNSLRFATEAYAEIVKNINPASVSFPVPDPEEFIRLGKSNELFKFILETQKELVDNVGKIGFLPEPPDPKDFIHDQQGLNDAIEFYADLLARLQTQPFELTPPDIAQFTNDMEGYNEAIRLFNAIKAAGEKLNIVFPVPTPVEFNSVEAFVEAYQRFFELIGQPLPVPVEELTEMAIAMKRVTEAMRLGAAMSREQVVSGQDSILLLQETREMIARLTDARLQANEAQQAQIDITLTALEVQEAELELLSRKQVALSLFGTVLDSTVNSLLQMAKAGTFSFKAVAKAVANAVAAELAALAIKNVVEGFEQLAIGFGLLANPATAALSKEAFTSAKLHFKTAALAGAGAAGAAALGAGGGAGQGQNNRPITTGADLTGSARTPTVTVIFEGGSNVLVEDREEFARTLAEQVIRAQADGVV